MPQEEAAQPSFPALRTVRYVRWNGMHHGDHPEPTEASVLVFVYDIPYFGACGVFPPFHLLNQLLARGGSTGGMSPGATWEPFQLSPTEYRDLVEAVRTIPPDRLREQARYAHVQFLLDPEFDGDPASYPVQGEAKRWDRHVPEDMKAYMEWTRAVCKQHREAHHAALRRAGLMK